MVKTVVVRVGRRLANLSLALGYALVLVPVALLLRLVMRRPPARRAATGATPSVFDWRPVEYGPADFLPPGRGRVTGGTGAVPGRPS